MSNEILNDLITLLAVIIGGFLTYLLQNRFAKRDGLRNKKLEVYLEFLEHATSVHSHKFTDNYYDIVRKLYLVASADVIDAMIKFRYIPRYGERSAAPKHEEEPLKNVVRAMRKA